MAQRIATTADGRQYVIDRIEFPKTGAPVVYCWGEVTRFHGPRTGFMRTTHARGPEGATFIRFAQSDVTVREVPGVDLALAEKLLKQAKRALRLA